MLKLGKKVARVNSVSLKFGAFFDATALPTPPPVFGKPGLVTRWGMFANDQVSDCVFAGAANETMLWRAWGGAPIPAFTDDTVLADYADATGYRPDRPDTDQGADLQEAASYRRKTGIADGNGVRHKIDAYLALHPGNIDEIALATFMFGITGIGLQLPTSAMDEFDNAEPWSRRGLTVEGGHYVPCVGRNSAGNFLVVTWGRLQAVTPAFLLRCMDEGIAYLSFEQMGGIVNPRGFDEAQLRAALAKVTA